MHLLGVMNLGAPNPLLTRDNKAVPPVVKAPKSLTKQRCVGYSSTLPQVGGGMGQQGIFETLGQAQTVPGCL